MNINDYISQFEMMDDELIYDFILEKGSNTKFPVERNNKNFVYGCQSDLWVSGRQGALGWEFFVDSDSYMVKGIGSVICECLYGMTTEELEKVVWIDFVPLTKFFSQQRKQGMQAIINKCKQISRGSK